MNGAAGAGPSAGTFSSQQLYNWATGGAAVIPPGFLSQHSGSMSSLHNIAGSPVGQAHPGSDFDDVRNRSPSSPWSDAPCQDNTLSRRLSGSNFKMLPRMPAASSRSGKQKTRPESEAEIDHLYDESTPSLAADRSGNQDLSGFLRVVGVKRSMRGSSRMSVYLASALRRPPPATDFDRPRGSFGPYGDRTEVPVGPPRASPPPVKSFPMEFVSELEKLDSTKIMVQFSNADAEKVFPAFFKGRCRKGELYGDAQKRELLVEAPITTSYQPQKSAGGYLPFNTLCKAQKYQSLYTSHDLRSAGLFNGCIIKSLSFKMADSPDRTLENFRIAYAWVADETLSEFVDTEVVHGPRSYHQSTLSVNEWVTFAIDPMEWDGRSSLVVEMSKDERHSSFSWPASGAIYMRNTQMVRSVGWKDNNDSSGQYPFPSCSKPAKFRKVPVLGIEVDSIPCAKVVCDLPAGAIQPFTNSLVQVDVLISGKPTRAPASLWLDDDQSPESLQALFADFARLLEVSEMGDMFSDVTFTVGRNLGEEAHCHAHQVILSARSAVFRQQLARLRREGCNMRLDLPDMRPAILRHLLRFLYTASVEIDMDVACELFKAADTYGLEELKLSCEEFLKQNATIDNITSLLLSAERWKVGPVRSFCLDFVLWHFDAVSVTQQFARDIVPKHDLMRDILLARRPFLEKYANSVGTDAHGGGLSQGRQRRDCIAVSFAAPLLADLTSLLKVSQDDKFVDVILNVGEGNEQQAFPAHKAILSTRCEVFAALFRSDMKETKDHVIQVPNIRPGVFVSVMQYLYTGQAAISTLNVFELYRAADQYVLDALKHACEEFVIQEITIDNVASFLVEAERWQVSSVRAHCLGLAVEAFNEVSITASFLDSVVPHHALMLEILQARIPGTLH